MKGEKLKNREQQRAEQNKKNIEYLNLKIDEKNKLSMLYNS